jgi:hypothetical protein
MKVQQACTPERLFNGHHISAFAKMVIGVCMGAIAQAFHVTQHCLRFHYHVRRRMPPLPEVTHLIETLIVALLHQSCEADEEESSPRSASREAVYTELIVIVGTAAGRQYILVQRQWWACFMTG